MRREIFTLFIPCDEKNSFRSFSHRQRREKNCAPPVRSKYCGNPISVQGTRRECSRAVYILAVLARARNAHSSTQIRFHTKKNHQQRLLLVCPNFFLFLFYTLILYFPPKYFGSVFSNSHRKYALPRLDGGRLVNRHGKL